jgi:hypothetical protein
MLNKAGRLRYMLCTEGRLTTLSAKADSPVAKRLDFASLRRHDLVSVRGGELREGGLGLVETSDLDIMERAPGTGD